MVHLVQVNEDSLSSWTKHTPLKCSGRVILFCDVLLMFIIHTLQEVERSPVCATFFGEIIIYVLLLVRTKCCKVYHPRKPHSPYFPPLMQYLGRQPPLLTGQVEAWLKIPGDSLTINTDNKYLSCLSSSMFYSMKYLTH